MIGRLFRRRRTDPGIPDALYGAIVAQARQAALYRDFGVDDSVDGRFEAVVLHTVLVLRRFGTGDEELRAAGQAVFDLFCSEMDRSLREMGVGDLSVPKRMRKIGEVYYGRAAAYDSALSAGDEAALAEAIRRSVPAAKGGEVAAGPLAAYMEATAAALAATPKASLMEAKLPFADLAASLSAEKTDDHQAAARHHD
jgi:cytochrome b pre-mRNA-processing protein 3